MKKKLRLAILATMLIPTLMVGCGNNSGGSTPQTQESGAVEAVDEEGDSNPDDAESTDEEAPARESGTLVMATEAGFPPYEYYDSNNEIAGVDVDIAREIAAELGMELEVEHMEFSSIIAAVNSGKADFGAAGISITDERKAQVDFSIEYATSRQVIMLRADSDIQGEDDLAGKTVGCQLSTVADIALTEDYEDIDVQRYNKYMDAVNDLIGGRIDAIVLDVLTGERLLQMDEENLMILEEELFTDVYAFCVQKGNDDLLESINTVMQRLLDEGKVEEYTVNHLGD